MTMQYDVAYMEKIRIMRKNLLRISEGKGNYDFSKQIMNDFLCLVILHVKGGIYKKKQAPYREHRQDMKNICIAADVAEALRCHTMTQLSLAEKMFVFFMKHHMYAAIFLAVRIYFR